MYLLFHFYYYYLILITLIKLSDNIWRIFQVIKIFVE